MPLLSLLPDAGQEITVELYFIFYFYFIFQLQNFSKNVHTALSNVLWLTYRRNLKREMKAIVEIETLKMHSEKDQELGTCFYLKFIVYCRSSRLV